MPSIFSWASGAVLEGQRKTGRDTPSAASGAPLRQMEEDMAEGVPTVKELYNGA